MVIFHSYVNVYQRIPEGIWDVILPIDEAIFPAIFLINHPFGVPQIYGNSKRPESPETRLVQVTRTRDDLSLVLSPGPYSEQAARLWSIVKVGSMDWFKGKSTGNHGFYHQIQGFPVNFPIIQFYDGYIG